MHKNKSVKPVVLQQRASPLICVAEASTSSSSTTAENNTRYFVNNQPKLNDNQKSNNSSNETVTLGSANPDAETSGEKNLTANGIDLCEINEEAKPFSQRKKLGKLPSFIPID